jgi:dTDP-4-dehydrorhamnose reductase
VGTDSTYWQGQRVLIAGGTGFLGGQFKKRPQALGAVALSCSRGEGLDLREPDAAYTAVAEAQPRVVINCLLRLPANPGAKAA